MSVSEFDQRSKPVWVIWNRFILGIRPHEIVRAGEKMPLCMSWTWNWSKSIGVTVRQESWTWSGGKQGQNETHKDKLDPLRINWTVSLSLPPTTSMMQESAGAIVWVLIGAMVLPMHVTRRNRRRRSKSCWRAPHLAIAPLQGEPAG